MSAQIILFEDEGFKNLFPLTHNRPVYDLRCGVLTLGEKVARYYPGTETAYHCRDYLTKLVKQKKGSTKVNANYQDAALWVNGRVVWSKELAQSIPVVGNDEVFMYEDIVVAARLSGESMTWIEPAEIITPGIFKDLPKTQVNAKVLNYYWDIVYENKNQLPLDFHQFGCNGAKDGKIYEGAYLLEPDQITIAQGAKVKPCTVLDAEDGPIFIDEGVQVLPHAYIQGPCYIGKNSIIKTSAKIYEGTTIGEVCKIGGEVEESIFHSYTNKQHDGFIGHSYIGSWVNIGADSNNSDLKNDYGYVKCFVNSEPVSSGRQFLGLSMGDHSKSGINTTFNTGTIIGPCCNLFGPLFLPKYIPSFSWGGQHRLVEYRFDKCMEVAKRVMQRRNQELTLDEEEVLFKIFEMEAQQRINFYLLMQ